jgi:diguanylate cyclase
MSDSSPPRRPVSPREVLDELDRAIDDHLSWLGEWNRMLVCGHSPTSGNGIADSHHLCRFGSWYVRNQHKSLVDQPVVRSLARLHWKMHDLGQELMKAVDSGEPPPSDQYAVFVETANAFINQTRRLEKAFAQAASDLDPLTGLHNRQAMFEELERQRTRTLRTDHPCSVALADLDHFKRVNDTYGHAAGDVVLRATADRFLARLRPYDSVYRYGGEEFLFCLPDADLRLAFNALERLRRRLESEPIILDTGEELWVTASFGVAEMGADSTVEESIEYADQALYSAKNGGRNRVSGWDGPGTVDNLADRADSDS